MNNNFEDLTVWKKAHALTLKIYKLTDKFPKEEKYRLIDQLCRAVSSIPANIAEGKGRYSKKEYRQFLYIARGSLEETKYHMILAKDLGYLKEQDYKELFCLASDVGKLLNGLIKSISFN